MRRTRLLLLLLVISVIFMCMQIYFYGYAGQKRSGNANKRVSGGKGLKTFSQSGARMASYFVGQENSSAANSYRTISTFTDITASHNIPVFLLEPVILSRVANPQRKHQNPDRQCKYLCHSKQLTTFAVIDKHWKEQEHYFSALEQNDFTWTRITGEDPRLLSVNSLHVQEIPLHYLFYSSRSHIIHLAIFYERNNNYWWHGPMDVEDTVYMKTGINTTALVIGRHSGAFDKMVISPIKIDGVYVHMPRDPSIFLEQLPHSKFIECNYRQAKIFLDENGDDITEEAEFFRMKAKRLLKRGKELLDKIGVRFWLSSGTCLGWYRECNTIAHSQDVDFGIWIKDYDTRLIPTFERNGLYLKHLFGKTEDSFELSFMSGDIKLDMFFFYEEGDTMWNGGTQARTGKKFKYVFPKFTLCWTEFLEMKVRVPCETQSYIEANYGKEWNKRVVEWDWKRSPPNVRENGQWHEEEWPQVIQVF